MVKINEYLKRTIVIILAAFLALCGIVGTTLAVSKPHEAEAAQSQVFFNYASPHHWNNYMMYTSYTTSIDGYNFRVSRDGGSPTTLTTGYTNFNGASEMTLSIVGSPGSEYFFAGWYTIRDLNGGT